MFKGNWAVLSFAAAILAAAGLVAFAADFKEMQDSFKKAKSKYENIERQVIADQEALTKNEADFQKAIQPILARKSWSSQQEKDKYTKWEAEIQQQRVNITETTRQKMAASEEYSQVIVDIFALDTLEAVKFLNKEILKKGMLSYPELNGCEKGVGVLKNKESIEYLADEIGSASPQVKILLCRGFGGIAENEKVIDALIALLEKDKSEWEIVSAVAGALGHFKSKKPVEPLIALLKNAENKKETRVAADIRDALRNITGKSDFNFASDFESWWNGGGKDSAPSAPKNAEKPADDAKKSRREKEKEGGEDDSAASGENSAPESGPSKGNKLSTYLYGEITSKRVIFIIDHSHSMSSVGTVPPLGGGDMSTGSDNESPLTGEKSKQDKEKEKEDVNKEEGGVQPGFKGTRLEAVKKEFKFILDKLPEDTMFNVIFFNQEVTPCFSKLMQATEKYKKTAWKLIEVLQPEGQTNSYGSLSTALGDKDVDTIYYLTDGAPTTGTPVVPDQICAQIKQLNQKRNVRIHCVALVIGVYSIPGQPAAAVEDKKVMIDFLRKLAKENDGTFKLIQD
jgi:hypothetical protein